MKTVIIGNVGVIDEIHDDEDSSSNDHQAIRGSLHAIARLYRAGWHVIVAGNQPELADGSLNPDKLARRYDGLRRRVIEHGGFIDAIAFCPHARDEACSCHLPAPGLLEDIARRLHINLPGLPVIGDSLAYVQAAQAAGAQPLLVKTGHGFGTVGQPGLDPDIPVFDDLYQAAGFLLAQDNSVNGTDHGE